MDTKQSDFKCDVCGMLYSEFLKTGNFGCQNCYKTFKQLTVKTIKEELQQSASSIENKTKKKPIHINVSKEQRRTCIRKEDEISKKLKELEELLIFYEKNNDYEKVEIIKSEIKKIKENEHEKF
ncbi:MAG: hypothetical protein J6C46_10805 [Clostridia bacterium]|nr:hypothetical protein [Clostridia bacterium]